MRNRIGLAVVWLVAVAALYGCGGGNGSSSPAVSVSIIPPSVAMGAGASLAFQAVVTGTSSGVTWSVLEGPTGGSITNTGVYTAPRTNGTFHVVATLASDSSKTAVATVSVAPSAVSITISPTQATVLPGQSQTFVGTVTGVPNVGVTYSVTESGGGTITSGGVYTAPTVAGTYHVVATSVVDTTQTATATVTVPPVKVTISPTTANLGPGGTQPFIATVTGPADTSVTYSVQEANGGTISASGVYTAPTTPGTYHVIAASTASPSTTAVATVTVSATTGIAITISPMSATVNQGGTQSFNATVTGASNTAVSFAVQEGAAGGTVSSTGVYTAPTVPGVYHVVATSLADTSQKAIATVTVPSVAIAVTVSPASAQTSSNPVAATVMAGGTLTIIPTVTGTVNTGVTFAIGEGAQGGTITTAGVYTAPQTPGTYHVSVTSAADTSKTTVVTITVQPGPTGQGTVIIQ